MKKRLDKKYFNENIHLFINLNQEDLSRGIVEYVYSLISINLELNFCKDLILIIVEEIEENQNQWNKGDKIVNAEVIPISLQNIREENHYGLNENIELEMIKDISVDIKNLSAKSVVIMMGTKPFLEECCIFFSKGKVQDPKIAITHRIISSIKEGAKPAQIIGTSDLKVDVFRVSLKEITNKARQKFKSLANMYH